VGFKEGDWKSFTGGRRVGMRAVVVACRNIRCFILGNVALCVVVQGYLMVWHISETNYISADRVRLDTVGFGNLDILRHLFMDNLEILQLTT
jgi:hypothetical protein